MDPIQFRSDLQTKMSGIDWEAMRNPIAGSPCGCGDECECGWAGRTNYMQMYRNDLAGRVGESTTRDMKEAVPAPKREKAITVKAKARGGRLAVLLAYSPDGDDDDTVAGAAATAATAPTALPPAPPPAPPPPAPAAVLPPVPRERAQAKTRGGGGARCGGRR